MKCKLLLASCAIACLPYLAGAQTTTVTKTKDNGTVKTKTKPSWWTAHNLREDRYVYFPDYYVFYEPDRGYVYWNNGKWSSSSSVPSYMSSVDMNSARVQVIEDMKTRPEVQYRTYMKSYPAQTVEVTVPVPDAR